MKGSQRPHMTLNRVVRQPVPPTWSVRMPTVFGTLILKVKHVQANRIDIDITEQSRPPMLLEPCLESSQVGSVPLHRPVAFILAPQIDGVVLKDLR